MSTHNPKPAKVEQKCPKCEKTFKYKSELNKHIPTSHRDFAKTNSRANLYKRKKKILNDQIDKYFLTIKTNHSTQNPETPWTALWQELWTGPSKPPKHCAGLFCIPLKFYSIPRRYGCDLDHCNDGDVCARIAALHLDKLTPGQDRCQLHFYLLQFFTLWSFQPF